MLKIGLELEEFCTKDGEVILIPKGSGISHDGCGWLIEYRSRPCTNILEAVFSLRAAEKREEPKLIEYGVKGLRVPILKPSKKVRQAARKRFIKSLNKAENIYGHTGHRNTLAEAVAAVHVSVTINREYRHGTHNIIWDYPQFIRYMDEAFKDEIKASKRRPGFYELKPDGRFEYRSLPNDISMEKLIEVIENYNF